MFTPKIYYYKLKKKLHLFNDKDYIGYHKSLLEYLDKKYGHIVSEWEWNSKKYEMNDVWTLWLQGEEAAPPLVKKCFKSMKQNLPKNMTLHILDENNLSDYIEFPEYIMEKYHKGIITKTHFSDLVRFKLLSTYGGIWIDSTVYVNSEVLKSELNEPLFTINEYDNTPIGRYISESKWTGFLLGGTDINFFKILDQLQMSYWNEENKMLDYFLIDYFIRLVYEKNESIHQMIDSIPVRETSILRLQQLLSKESNTEEILMFLSNQHHHFNKLSNKRKLYIEVL